MPLLKILLATLALACASNALAAEPPRVLLETSVGAIELELDAQNAPISTENFLTYVRDGHYDGLIFHRVIANFMIQGGGFSPDMQKKATRAPIKNEATNGVVDSATAQFFINVVDNAFLNHRSTNPREYGYAVFGRVTSGMDVVDRIRAAPTTTVGGLRDFPREPVVITRATVIGEEPPEEAPADQAGDQKKAQ
jgi:cyclophilin family peptidyl-prolyl cis-trans isomerase